MNRHRHAEPVCAEDDRQLGVRELAGAIRVVERAPQRLAHAARLAHATHERLVHLASRLLRHPEAAVAEANGDVLGCSAEPRNFKVVNRRRTVHREMRDDAAAHQIDEEWGEARLHDVPAEHDDDTALTPCGGDDRVDDAPEVARDEHVGERRQKRSEAAVVGGRMGELLRLHLVRAPRHGNGADRAKVGLGSRPFELRIGGHGGEAAALRSDGGAPGAAAREYDLKYRFSEPKGNFDFVWSMMRFESLESQTSARPPSEKMPLVLMIGWRTMASTSPAGTEMCSRLNTRIVTGLRSGRK